MRAGVEAEDQQIVGEPVRVQGMIPQDRFLRKAKPLEQLQRTGLFRCHAGDDFRHPHVQHHLERQFQQEPADSDSAGGLRHHHAKLSDMATSSARLPRSNVA